MSDGCDAVFYEARPNGRWWPLICDADAFHAGPHRLVPLGEMNEIPPADWHRTLIVDPKRVVWQPKPRGEREP